MEAPAARGLVGSAGRPAHVAGGSGFGGCARPVLKLDARKWYLTNLGIMASITHRFVSPKPDSPDLTIVRPSNWNDVHQVVYQVRVVTGTTTIALADDVVRLQAGTYSVVVPLATGSGSQITVCQDGAGAMTLVPTGSDTIGGQTSVVLSSVGSSCVLVDEGAGTWGLLGPTSPIPDFADSFVESSGIIWGLTLRINPGNPGVFDLLPGAAVFVDNFTTPGSTVKTTLTFPSGISSITPVFGVGGRHPVYIAMGSTGNVIQSPSEFGFDDYVRHVVIGVIAVNPTTSTVVAVYQTTSVSYAATARLAQLCIAIGSFNVSGDVYAPSALSSPTMKLQRSAGQIFRLGTNYGADNLSPDLPLTPPADPEKFFPMYHVAGNWFYPPAPVTDVDPNYYDNLTNLVAMTPGQFQIKTIFYSVGIVYQQYGQAEYPTLAAAQAAINQSFLISPVITSSFVFRAFLIVQQGCTDLNDPTAALFIPAGKWGLAVGSGIGPSPPIHTPFYSTATVSGLLTVVSGYSSYMVSGAEDVLGISTSGVVPGDIINVTFMSARTLKQGASTPAGFAPLLLLHMPGEVGYQDIVLQYNDGRCTFQLRSDNQWQLIAGGNS
jgi:hypothetical protein